MDIVKLIALAERVQKDLGEIRKRVTGAVMFVDLVGSTDFKAEHPSEDAWLPRLATFLTGVTGIVQEHGRVVKYIGDEVMAFFAANNPVLAAEHAAEQILQFCERFTRYTFEVRIALDYGPVSMLDFVSDKKAGFGRNDPNGLTVDRCARIMAKTPANVVLCSGDFREASTVKSRWRPAGCFHAKGIPGVVNVFQLNYDSQQQVTVRDSPMSLEQCLRQLEATEKHLEEEKALRKPVLRRPQL